MSTKREILNMAFVVILRNSIVTCSCRKLDINIFTREIREWIELNTATQLTGWRKLK